jgi:hypothetical protein
VPGLISQIDGIHAILFHVEHSGGVPWQYRWRIVGDYPPPYLVWREETTTRAHVRIEAEIRDCSIEVEWRPVEEEIGDSGLEIGDEEPLPGDSSSSHTPIPDPRSPIAAGPWLPVSQFRLTTPRAVFTILADHVFSPAEEFIVCAPVRDDGVAAYRFPAVSLEPGFEARAYGQADAPAWANVLLTPGEFRPRIAGITITNVAPSEDAWEEIPHEGPFQLCQCPLSTGRRWFAVGHDLVPAGMIPARSPFES